MTLISYAIYKQTTNPNIEYAQKRKKKRIKKKRDWYTREVVRKKFVTYSLPKLHGTGISVYYWLIKTLGMVR